MTQLFTISNLVAQAVARSNPWDYTGEQPDRTKWSDPATNYCHFSGYEGMLPAQRIGTTNPPAVLHAMVADFDAVYTAEQVTKAAASAKVTPNWTSSTGKGGCRMVWLLADPVPLLDGKLVAAFLDTASKRLGLTRLLPEWDRAAWENVATYYAAGTNWTKTSDKPLEADTVAGWMLEAGNRLNWRKSGGVVIPVESIQQEAETRWTGGWGGSWAIGARGRNFWEPMASGNPRACVLRETGFQCFSGAKAFYTFRDVFGAAFVEKYEADRVGAAVNGIYFDGENYWANDGGTTWEKTKRVDLLTTLKVRGLSASTERGDTCSEVDRALVHINQRNRVTAAGQWVYFRPGLQRVKGELVLNRSRVRPLPPVEHHSGSWGDGFPRLADWLDHLLADPIQLDYLMAWLRRFYSGAAAYKPNKGLSLFIAGPVNRGKTYLSDKVISTLMGGHYDIGDYMTDGGSFANGCYEHGLWTVGDARPANDWKSRQQYTARLKKLVANREFLANEKYEKAYMTQWYGRVIVTCNDDPVSIQMLPDLDQSTSDKVAFLRISRDSKPVPPDADAVAEEELPYLAGWLLASVDSEFIEQDSRLGQVAFHDRKMAEVVRSGGRAHLFEELLYAAAKDIAGDDGTWKGNATELFKALAAADQASMREHSPVTVGQLLTQLLSLSRPYIQFKRGGNSRAYTIDTARLTEFFNDQTADETGLFEDQR